MKTFILIIKDVKKTAIMQNFDLFEKFKFIGVSDTFEMDALTAEEMLRRFNSHRAEDDPFQAVAVIEPEVSMAVLPNHRVMSDGNRWRMLSDIASNHGADRIVEVDLSQAPDIG